MSALAPGTWARPVLVARCPLCHWRRPCFGRPAYWRATRTHQRIVHPQRPVAFSSLRWTVLGRELER